MGDSGDYWLDQIPSDWHVVRGKDLFRKLSLSVRDEDEVVTCFRNGETTLRKNRREEGFTFALKECGYQGVRAGNLVIHAMDAFAGAIGISDSNGKCSPVYSVCAARFRAKAYLPYYCWVVKNMATSGFIQSVAKGIRERSTDFRFSEVETAYFAQPLIDEQRRIAAWLDLQTGRIDMRLDLLNQKRELLRDLKKTVIEDATFRGCNAGVKLRDSEIEWLGEVPSQWNTVRLGSLFREAANPGIAGLPMLSVSIHSGISDKELNDEELDRKVSRSEDITLYKRVKPGDLVYNQMRAWQGAFGAAKVEGLVSPAYVVARPGKAVVPTFIEYLLRAPAAMEEIRRRSRGITDFRLRLYWDEFKNIRIALPPKDEQEAIAAFLDRKLSQIDTQIGLIDQLETLLKEQRKAIIHEAVTGKIDLSAYEPPSQEAITA